MAAEDSARDASEPLRESADRDGPGA